jgi:hypothetical protein
VISALCDVCKALIFAIRGCRLMSCVESSVGGIGVSLTDVKRDAVEE